MDEKKAPAPRVDVKIIKSSSMDAPTVFYTQQKVEKSDKGEQLDPSTQKSASDWIPHAIDMRGLSSWLIIPRFCHSASEHIRAILPVLVFL